jgi:hypothetical protein
VIAPSNSSSSIASEGLRRAIARKRRKVPPKGIDGADHLARDIAR